MDSSLLLLATILAALFTIIGFIGIGFIVYEAGEKQSRLSDSATGGLVFSIAIILCGIFLFVSSLCRYSRTKVKTAEPAKIDTVITTKTINSESKSDTVYVYRFNDDKRK